MRVNPGNQIPRDGKRSAQESMGERGVGRPFWRVAWAEHALTTVAPLWRFKSVGFPIKILEATLGNWLASRLPIFLLAFGCTFSS